MKQLTDIKKNTLEWWDKKEPELESEQDVIVRPLAAARSEVFQVRITQGTEPRSSL